MILTEASYEERPEADEERPTEADIIVHTSSRST